MRKIISVIFAFISLTIIFASCKGDTYADKLKKEEKAINRFIDAQGIKVINSYPASRVFGNKEYFKDPDTGIYIHVIDSGSKDKIEKNATVYMRYYDTKTLITTPDSTYTNDKPGEVSSYMQMVYGNKSTYTYPTQGHYMYMFLSAACARPLDFNLGNNAEVSLIVPFANGSTLQSALYEPIFYGRLKYTFIKDELQN